MKTNNSDNLGRKAVGLTGTNIPKKATGIKASGMRGRRKKNVDDDQFADLNMSLDADDHDISSSWSGSSGRRKNYSDDEDSDSYEGTGYGRGRLNYGSDDELDNDPYETFRRG